MNKITRNKIVATAVAFILVGGFLTGTMLGNNAIRNSVRISIVEKMNVTIETIKSGEYDIDGNEIEHKQVSSYALSGGDNAAFDFASEPLPDDQETEKQKIIHDLFKTDCRNWDDGTYCVAFTAFEYHSVFPFVHKNYCAIQTTEEADTAELINKTKELSRVSFELWKLALLVFHLLLLALALIIDFRVMVKANKKLRKAL